MTNYNGVSLRVVKGYDMQHKREMLSMDVLYGFKTLYPELAVRALNREIPGSRVRADRQARALTSYFGIGHIPALDRNDAGIKLISGDKILLASDGVFGTLTDQTLEALMAMEPEAAAQAMAERIAAADKRYQDNHTAVILEYQE